MALRAESSQARDEYSILMDQPSPSVLHPLLEHLWVLHPSQVVTAAQGVPIGSICILGWL